VAPRASTDYTNRARFPLPSWEGGKGRGWIFPLALEWTLTAFIDTVGGTLAGMVEDGPCNL
jgi:hypothetical protein